MTHGPGRFATATLAALCALAPATVATAAGTPTSTTGGGTATITDGCGRVDRVVGDSSLYVEALPDGKAGKVSDTATTTAIADIRKKAPAERTEEDWVLLSGYVPLTGGEWRRAMDTSKSYVQVRVLAYDKDGRFEPVPLELAGADSATAVIGTESFRITNEDCVTPTEPTFTDEDGSDKDTVTIPQATGVKYSGKPGTSPGKGTVTVVATPDKGYRFADADGVPVPAEGTRWTHTFDGTAPASVPDDKTPVLRLGAVIPATKTKPASRGPNVVVLRYVPGVSWIVDGKTVKVAEKSPIVEVPVGAKTSVEVQAVSADPKAYVLDGTSQWTVELGGDATLPTVLVPTSAVALGASTVAWTPPADFADAPKFNVRVRPITLTKNNVRATRPWQPWLQEFSGTSLVLKAKPGTVVEV